MYIVKESNIIIIYKIIASNTSNKKLIKNIVIYVSLKIRFVKMKSISMLTY